MWPMLRLEKEPHMIPTEPWERLDDIEGVDHETLLVPGAPALHLDEPVTFVTWKWTGPDQQRVFLSQHVNVLRAMLARHCKVTHTLVCITDDPAGLDPRVEVYPMPDTSTEHLGSPHSSARKQYPACYRRLWVFSREARVLGRRLFCTDIDVIVVGDLQPLVETPGDFVGWCSKSFGWSKIAGGCYLLKAGSHPEIWEDFDPATSPHIAHEAGNKGSDQAWMSYKLYPPERSWSDRDGVVKLNWLKKAGQAPPPGTRLIYTDGHSGPWSAKTQLQHKWVKNFWTL